MRERYQAQSRIPELDGLRGIAILLVISFHYLNNQLAYGTNTVGRLLANATAFGWTGVDLFFVLSGFLIGSILISNKGAQNYFKPFFARRIVRIIPAYFLALGVFILILNLPYFQGNHFFHEGNVIPMWSYFAMLHNVYMGFLNTLGNPALSITWSIGIEEQFYIIFPFIVYFLKDRWLPFLLIFLIITAMLLRSVTTGWIPAYVWLPCRMDGLALGVLIAWLNQRIDLKAVVHKYKALLVGILIVDVMLCVGLYYMYDDLSPKTHTLFAIAFGLALVFALTWKNSWYGAALRNRYLTRVGAISYSLYLFHFIMLGVVHHIFGNRLQTGIRSTRDMFITLVALVASLVFSWMIYRFVETPFVNFGKRFKY